MESLAYELGIPFAVKLENPHVIGGDQVFLGVLGTGPSGYELNSSYEKRNDTRYKQVGRHCVRMY